MYLSAFLIAVSGCVTYHLAMKQIPANLNPFFALSVAYLIAFILSMLGVLVYPDGSRQLTDLRWSVFGVALGIIGIEAGFLLAYRAGWNVGYAALAVNVLSTLLLLPIAILVIKQGLSVSKLTGVLLCSIGLSLLLKQ